MCFVLFSWFLIWRLCCASSRNWILRIPYIQVSCSISSFKTQLTNMHVQYSRERNSSISRWLIERASSMVYVGSSYWWTLCHTHGYQDKVNLSSFESTYQDKVNLSKINRQWYEMHPFFLWSLIFFHAYLWLALLFTNLSTKFSKSWVKINHRSDNMGVVGFW